MSIFLHTKGIAKEPYRITSTFQSALPLTQRNFIRYFKCINVVQEPKIIYMYKILFTEEHGSGGLQISRVQFIT